MISSPEQSLPRQERTPESIDIPITQPVVQVIRPRTGWTAVDWPELWRYRELLYFLTWRDVKIRYKQTVLGAAWAILQPFLTMVVFSLFFGRLAGLGQKTGGVPYPIYVYAGLLPWTFFANSISNSSSSLIGNSSLITKVYFPRLMIPLALVGAGLVDFVMSLAVLLGMMVYYQTPVSWHLTLAPVCLFGTVLVAVGVSTLMSALTVAYRDFRYVVPFLVQLWMFVTPVIYPPTILPRKWCWLLSLNPLAAPVEGFRASLLDRPASVPHMAISALVGALVFVVGLAYFRSVERDFADII